MRRGRRGARARGRTPALYCLRPSGSRGPVRGPPPQPGWEKWPLRTLGAQGSRFVPGAGERAGAPGESRRSDRVTRRNKCSVRARGSGARAVRAVNTPGRARPPVGLFGAFSGALPSRDPRDLSRCGHRAAGWHGLSPGTSAATLLDQKSLPPLGKCESIKHFCSHTQPISIPHTPKKEKRSKTRSFNIIFKKSRLERTYYGRISSHCF